MRRLGIVIGMAAALLAAGAATGQSVSEQAAGLADHASGQAGAAAADPSGFAGNATNATWQGTEVNWTKEWSCTTADVTAPPAADALRELGACPEAQDVAAGAHAEEDDAHNHTVAEAEELGNDTATAVEDEVAAVEELAEDVLEDPTGAPGAIERFVERTREFIQKILGLPRDALDAVAGAMHAVAGTIAQAGETIGGAAGEAVAAVGRFFATVGDAVVAAAKATYDGVLAFGHGFAGVMTAIVGSIGGGAGAVVDATVAGASAIADGATKLAEGTVDVVGGAVTAVVEAVKGLAGGVGLPTSGPGGDGVRDKVRAPELGLGDGIQLPLDL